MSLYLPDGQFAPAEPCAFDSATQLLGDRWTLLILRDIVFEDRRTFRALLTGSREGISSNILAKRLRRMLDAGLLSVVEEKNALGQKPYALTARAIALVPLMAHLGAAGLRDAPGPGDLAARLFFGGGPKLWAEMQEDLLAAHVDGVPLAKRLVRYRLRDAVAAALRGQGPVAVTLPPARPALPAPLPEARLSLAAPGCADAPAAFIRTQAAPG